LTVAGKVTPQRLGEWNGATHTFHATSAGEGTLALTVYREDLHLAGQKVVPVIVRGNSTPGPGGADPRR